MFNKVYSSNVNVVAMISGNFWGAALSIFFVPVYLHIVGPEGYGLIGVLGTFQSFITLLDLGLSSSINRELARLSADPSRASEMPDLKRTLELPSWLIAAAVTFLLFAIAPIVGSYWLQPKDLSVSDVVASMVVIAGILGTQYVVNFYNGALFGLQRQTTFAIINVTISTVRTLGAALVLIYVSSTIVAFLLWQFVVSLAQLAWTILAVKSSLPREPKGRFRREILRRVGRFAAGMTGVSVIGLVLTQTDKIILSKLIDLETFGYYILAVSLSTVFINTLAGSVNQAIYPSFARLQAQGDEKALAEMYHKSSEYVAVLLLPATVFVVLFSYEILTVWTRNATVAANAYLLLSLVVMGNTLQGMTYLAGSMQLAHGWTRLHFGIALTAMILIVPIMVLAVSRYGAEGGAVSWVLMSAFSFAAHFHFMHRKILIAEKWRWMRRAVVVPALVSIVVAGLGRYWFKNDQSYFVIAVELAVVYSLTLLAVGLSVRGTRKPLLAFIRKLRAEYRPQIS